MDQSISTIRNTKERINASPTIGLVFRLRITCHQEAPLALTPRGRLGYSASPATTHIPSRHGSRGRQVRVFRTSLLPPPRPRLSLQGING